mgnify:CR=1 FL=1
MKNKFHIIYCTYDGLSDPLGQSQILPYINGINTSQNYKFTIISFEKQSTKSIIKIKLRERLNKSKINWVELKYTKYPPILSTLLDINKLKKSIEQIHKKENIDVIHCRSYITSLVAVKFKIKQNVPFIFDMRGFYADERVDGKIWNRKNPLYNNIYKYFKKKEIELIQRSNHIVSLTESARKEIISSFRVKS